MACAVVGLLGPGRLLGAVGRPERLALVGPVLLVLLGVLLVLLREHPPGRLGGPLLGLLLAAALRAAVPVAGHHDPGGERLEVVRSGALDPVLGHAETERGGQLLEAGLPVQGGAPTGRLGHQRVEEPVDHDPGGVQPVLEVDGAQQRLQGVGEDARLVPATGGLLALAEQQVRAEAVRAQATGHVGERPHVDHARPQLRQLPLGQVRVVVEQRRGDHHAEDRVAEELQPLVRRQATVLVRVRAVGQRAFQQVRFQADAERGFQVSDGRPPPLVVAHDVRTSVSVERSVRSVAASPSSNAETSSVARRRHRWAARAMPEVTSSARAEP